MPGELSTTVWATLSVPGFHHWPDAPAHRAYLRSPHRHLFGLRAEVAVGHDDRQVEVHDLQEAMAAWWLQAWPAAEYVAQGSPPRDCGPASCERIAAGLCKHLQRGGMSVVRVDVSEDGECGAAVAPVREG